MNVGRTMKLMLILDNFWGAVPVPMRTEIRCISRQRCYFRLGVLACLGPLLWGAPPAHARELQNLSEEYEMRIQQVADHVIVPRLVEALSSKERTRLGSFRVEVLASKDSLLLELRADTTQGNTLVVSVGTMFIHDLLVDASVLWALRERPENSISYALDVTRFALDRKQGASSQPQPKPYWELLGWDHKEYESRTANPQYSGWLARSRVETLAWIVARAIVVCAASADEYRWRSSSTEQETRLVAQTADLLMRARFSGLPALGPTIFFYGLQHPSLESEVKWLCFTKLVLGTAISIAERDRARASPIWASRIGEVLARRKQVAEMLTQRGKCP